MTVDQNMPALGAPRTVPLPTDPKWSDAAQQAELEALPKLRGIAEKWAATVGTLGGLFATVALISAPSRITDIAPDWQTPVAWTVLAAVVSAAIAVFLASFAAQGGSAAIVATGPEFKKLSARETQRARNYLNGSRSVTMLALAALAVAFIMAALNPAPEAASSNVVVTYHDPIGRRTVCGALVSADSGIKIRPGGGRADLQLPLHLIETVTPVSSCAAQT